MIESNYIIDENKYNKLFVEKFKADEAELKNDLKRFVKKCGHSEEVKLSFYKGKFVDLIYHFKTELPKTEDYEKVIMALYECFIMALKEDNIEVSRLEIELRKFKLKVNLKIPLEKQVYNYYRPEHRTYNLNTQYGRRKAREQAIRKYENGSQEYRDEIDKIRTIVWLIIIVITIFVFIMKALLTSK